MKNYAKIGNRNGRPAYRTQASFRYKQIHEANKRGMRAPQRFSRKFLSE